jgi:methyltransferase-like protein/2-polyprenyl-3-methyl-5-hydroxy-6-metoxy-1,4-benzoquinol methylase
MENEPEQTSYDEVPYESRPFAQTHPDRLATLGRLFSLSPVPITQCRVLELGCAGGGNLIPMAYQLPMSQFVGVDFSKRQVEMGRQVIQDLSLCNIRIEHANIMDVDQAWGVFDYIICHGVYSWVPDDAQEKILAISKENLAENGIAYVSYNAYPGWHMREMIRHMMLYHADQFEDTKERIEQARALMQFLESSVPTENNYYGQLLKNEFDLIKRSQDSYLFHEHLEDINVPIYFYQFMERAEKNGLQYLAEADFATMLTSGFSKQISETLNRISRRIINTEQYMDFLRNRTFRQTLLCNKGLPLKRNVGAEDVHGLLVASAATPEPELVDLGPDKKQVFQTGNGFKAETDYPLTKAALKILKDHWPRGVDFSDLAQEATSCSRASYAIGDVEEQQSTIVLCQDLLQCYTGNVVEFHTWQADFVTEISKTPMVSKLAAYQANNGPLVVNQRHELIKLDPVSKALVKTLDGTRNHVELSEYLTKCAVEGALVLEENGRKITETKKIKDALEAAMEKALTTLASSALLMG